MRTRRDFLVRIIVAGGMATPLPAAIAKVLEDSASRTRFKVLAPAQVSFLEHLADIIIPATDTPAASKVGVVRFIDSMLADWYRADESREYLKGLGLCRAQAGAAPTHEYVSKLDSAAFAAEKPAERLAKKSAEEFDSVLARFYRTTKRLVLIGYFTSREGMQDALHVYGPVGQSSFEPSGPPGNDIRY